MSSHHKSYSVVRQTCWFRRHHWPSVWYGVRIVSAAGTTLLLKPSVYRSLWLHTALCWWQCPAHTVSDNIIWMIYSRHMPVRHCSGCRMCHLVLTTQQEKENPDSCWWIHQQKDNKDNKGNPHLLKRLLRSAGSNSNASFKASVDSARQRNRQSGKLTLAIAWKGPLHSLTHDWHNSNILL